MEATIMVNIPVNQQMIAQCFNFATAIINNNNQYNRIPSTTDTRIERTFAGKLAELSFLNYLNNNGKNYPVGTMFQVFQGQQNTDGYDFITRTGQNSVDVKSASKPYHSRIMVPIDQFNNIPKDFYVGVRINAQINDDNKILLNTIQSADIFGYCTYQQLYQSRIQNYGHPCKAVELNALSNIQPLLNLF